MLPELLSTSVGIPSVKGTLAREARLLQVASGQREQRQEVLKKLLAHRMLWVRQWEKKIKESCLETQTDAQNKKKKDRGLTGRHETHPSLSQGKKSKNSGGGVSWRFSAEKLCLIHQMKWSGERKEEGKQALSWKSQRLRASWKISCRTLHRSRLFWSWPLSSEVSPKKKKKNRILREGSVLKFTCLKSRLRCHWLAWKDSHGK